MLLKSNLQASLEQKCIFQTSFAATNERSYSMDQKALVVSSFPEQKGVPNQL